MILDKKFSGILDQGEGVLIIFQDQAIDKTYSASLDTIHSISKVVDSLYTKAKRLSWMEALPHAHPLYLYSLTFASSWKVDSVCFTLYLPPPTNNDDWLWIAYNFLLLPSQMCFLPLARTILSIDSWAWRLLSLDKNKFCTFHQLRPDVFSGLCGHSEQSPIWMQILSGFCCILWQRMHSNLSKHIGPLVFKEPGSYKLMFFQTVIMRIPWCWSQAVGYIRLR